MIVSDNKKVDLSKRVDRLVEDKRKLRKLDLAEKKPSNRLKLTSHQRLMNKQFKMPKSLERTGKVLKTTGKVGTGASKVAGGAATVIQSAAQKDNSAGNQAIASGIQAAQIAGKGVAAGARGLRSATHAIATAAKAPRAIAHEVCRTARLAKLKKHGIKLSKRKWYNHKIRSLGTARKTLGAAKAAGSAFSKVANFGKNTVMGAMTAAQRYIRSDDSTGNAAANVGIQGARITKSGVEVGGRAIKTGVNATKRTARTLSKVIDPGKRRMLMKSVKRQAGNVKRSVKTAVKGTAKASKATVKAAKATAKVTAKAAKMAAKLSVQAAKAVVQGVVKIVSLIAETLPWSLIVIGAVLLIILTAAAIGGASGAASATTKGSGGWTGEDNKTGEEVYQTINKFVKESGDVLKDKALKPLKSTIDTFCDSDTEDPRKIIQYQSKAQNVTFYPAKGNNSTIDGYIDAFDLEFYPDFLATLFVLMTRDKLQAENLPETEIANFEFKKADFEEFINGVNANLCKYKQTYVYKTTQTVENCYCPNQNCKRKTISGCKCACSEDENGKKRYYCGGHPYCPKNHTKLVVSLYTIQELKEMKPAAIYDFTENEKIRFDAAKAFIEAMNKSYGGESN